ncbi:hypothetical protein PAPHI01_2704 [Pancytospora philotis]|nr:hypothetical protein PAPHI01_2704 [Pancytospora philotis]
MAIDSITIGKILALSEAGFGQAEIAEKFGITQSTVSHCLKRHALGGPTTYSKSSGRPTVVSAAIETTIMRQNKACPTFSLRKHVAKLASDYEITISYSTVRCVLDGNGVAAHSPAKKPALLARHIENWFAAARAWIGFAERGVMRRMCGQKRLIQFVQKRMHNLIHCVIWAMSFECLSYLFQSSRMPISFLSILFYSCLIGHF